MPTSTYRPHADELVTDRSLAFFRSFFLSSVWFLSFFFFLRLRKRFRTGRFRRGALALCALTPRRGLNGEISGQSMIDKRIDPNQKKRKNEIKLSHQKKTAKNRQRHPVLHSQISGRLIRHLKT